MILTAQGPGPVALVPHPGLQLRLDRGPTRLDTSQARLNHCLLLLRSLLPQIWAGSRFLIKELQVIQPLESLLQAGSPSPPPQGLASDRTKSSRVEVAG